MKGRTSMDKKNTGKRRDGFTMVELMAVLIILGLLGAVVVISFAPNIEKAKVTTTMTSLKNLHNAVTQFKMDTGRYPTEEAGLFELIEEPTDVTGWTPGGYLETTEIPPDAWGKEFVYLLNPESGKAFVIISFGANGEEGGEGFDADLYSTDAR